MTVSFPSGLFGRKSDHVTIVMKGSNSGDMSIVRNSDERADAAAEHTKQYTKASVVKC